MFPAHAGMNRSGWRVVIVFSVFPAHAGMNRVLNGGDGRVIGVPRPRGDEPTAGKPESQALPCSPPTRG